MSEKQYCPYCGGTVPEGAAFCSNCGGPISSTGKPGTTSAPPSSPSQPPPTSPAPVPSPGAPPGIQPSYAPSASYEKREINILDTVSQGIGLYLSNFGGIFIPFVVLAIAGAFLGGGMELVATVVLGPLSFLQDAIVGFFSSVITGIFSSLAGGVVVSLAAKAYLGQELESSESLDLARSRIVPLIIGSILYAIAVAIGILLFIIPGLYLMTVYALWQPCVMLEQNGGYGLNCSSKLTKNNRWEIFWITVVLFVVIAIVGAILGVFVGGIIFLLPTVPLMIRVFISGLLLGIFGAFTAPLTVVTATVIYFKVKGQ